MVFVWRNYEHSVNMMCVYLASSFTKKKWQLLFNMDAMEMSISNCIRLIWPKIYWSPCFFKSPSTAFTRIFLASKSIIRCVLQSSWLQVLGKNVTSVFNFFTIVTLENYSMLLISNWDFSYSLPFFYFVNKRIWNVLIEIHYFNAELSNLFM